jgi:DNA-directed RNA polymerase specialized sigma24 family protein
MDTTDKKKSKNYIENDTVYKQILEWKTEYDKVFEDTGEHIGVSEDLTKSIYTIANQLSNRYNFNGYSFRDDMIQDAMYVILKYMRNYDITKTNPHAYITTCCWNAFTNRINIEKKDMIKKYKHYVNFVETNADTLASESGSAIDYEIVDQMYSRINDYETKPLASVDDEFSEIDIYVDKKGNPNLKGFF